VRQASLAAAPYAPSVPEIVVLADGHPGAGLGHLMRSTALSCALSLADVDVRCLALEAPEARTIDGVRWEPGGAPPPLGPDAVVVLDSYRLDAPARAALLARHAVVTFGEREPAAAAARGLEIAPALPARPGRLTGLEHACLRRAFWVQPPRRPRDEIGRVLVSAGGGPTTHDARLALARAAAAALPDAALRVVGPPTGLPAGAESVTAGDLAGEMRRADVVVTAAGQTALEAAACGAPAVAVAIVDNQRAQARLLDEAGAAIVVGAIDEVPGALRGLVAADARAALGARAQEAVDGLGALRCARAVLGLLDDA